MSLPHPSIMDAAMDLTSGLQAPDAALIKPLLVTVPPNESDETKWDNGTCSGPPQLELVSPADLKTAISNPSTLQNVTSITIKSAGLNNAHIQSLSFLNTQLEVLALPDNDLFSVPEAIGTFSKLRALDLSNNPISSVPTCVSRLASTLQRLVMNECRLSDIQSVIYSLPQLRVLHLSGNLLQSLSFAPNTPAVSGKSISCLENLYELNVSKNKLDTLGDVCSLMSLKWLDLSGNCLQNLSADIVYLRDNLQTLLLHDNPFMYIPAEIFTLDSLRSLTLSRCAGVTRIPTSIWSMIFMTHLSLAGNGLEFLPQELWHLVRLRKLDLSTNKLSSISGSIGELFALEELDLSHNSLRSVPEEISLCTFLKAINLSNNDLGTLPVDMVNLRSLEILDISTNLFDEIFPTCISLLMGLRILRADGNTISRIGPEFCVLTQLTQLSLAKNSFTTLPAILAGTSSAKLDSLETVDLSVNSIEWVEIGAADVAGCPNLRFLQLTNNNFEKFPLGLCELKNLLELDLSNCGLTNVPARVREILSLEVLNLSDNSLEEFPVMVFDIPNLTVLKYQQQYGMQLPYLPNSFNLLTKLEVLDVSYNSLAALPPSVGEMSNLIALYANNNELVTIPTPLCSLTSLEVLHLHENSLESLPEEFGALSKLYDLRLDGNPLCRPPQSVCQGACPAEIGLYVRRLSSRDALLREKMFEVISGRVDKAELKLLWRKFQISPEEILSIENKFKGKDQLVPKVAASLDIWGKHQGIEASPGELVRILHLLGMWELSEELSRMKMAAEAVRL